MKASANFDFDDEKYSAPPSQVLPWCQMINPRVSQTEMQSHGLAISLENANAVNFIPDDTWERVEHEFSDNEVKTLFITPTPRLVIVRRGPLSVKDRETGKKLGTFKEYEQAFLADKLKFKTFTRHLIFLVGKNRKFLHESPLQISLSGAASASFNKAYSNRTNGVAGGFIAELEKAYAQYRQQPLAPKGPLFHAHGIFCPIIEVEERGTGLNTALVSTTSDYGHPTADNLTKFMIASDSLESATISKIFEEYKDFGKEPVKPEMPKMELAGVSSSYDYPDEFEYGEPPY
jgi:hypothetical protein